MPWSTNRAVPNQLSKAPAALASHDGLLHLAHIGDTSNRIWHSTWDGNAWTPNVAIPGQLSKSSPALASHDGLLHMVHAGDTSNRIWHSTSDGNAWTPNVAIPNQLSKAPAALASHDGLLHMAHIGDTSNRIWHSTWDGNAWTPNVAIPGQLSKSSPALASHDGLLHMVHAGDTSNRIWHSTWDGNAWTPNVRVPGQRSRAPSALVSHEGILHLLHIGDTSNRIWHSTRDLAWRPNTPIPNQLSKSSPAVTNHGGVLQMVHAGDSSNRIWHSRSLSNHTNNIMVTGYWPPTNHMLRRFSTDPALNPDGWRGRNWRGHGFDVFAFFPDLDNPNVDPVGTGDFTVNYPDTWDDFRRISSIYAPVAIITFSRGDPGRSWEIEARVQNRSSWLRLPYTPEPPDPEPPDEGVPPDTIRWSTLPMEAIRQAVDGLGLGLDVFIDDSSPDLAGGFLSEFIGYLGVWHQSLHAGVDSPTRCLAAGHVHVGINVPLADAVPAAERTIETVIGHLEERIDGTAGRFIANRRTKETHSYLRPCRWVSWMARKNRWVVDDKPATYKWCDWCFPDRRDG